MDRLGLTKAKREREIEREREEGRGKNWLVLMRREIEGRGENRPCRHQQARLLRGVEGGVVKDMNRGHWKIRHSVWWLLASLYTSEYYC